jgi:hypothetical protein
MTEPKSYGVPRESITDLLYLLKLCLFSKTNKDIILEKLTILTRDKGEKETKLKRKRKKRKEKQEKTTSTWNKQSNKK